MKSKIIKILYNVASVILVGVVIFHISIPVVAGTTVESLPNSDVDVSVSYDSDNLYLSYEDNTYTMPFHYDIRLRDANGNPYDNWLFWYKSDGSATTYTDKWGNTPKWTDKDAFGNILPFSYWFSPSENRVYVITHYVYNYPIRSYSNGVFHMVDDTYTFTAFNYWNLSDMSFNRIGLLGMTTESYIDGVYLSWQIDSSVNVSTYRDSSGALCSFPSDLICLYANYEISGFYEFSYESVYTPEYFFDYRYLFFVEGVGYTFIDSAMPLDYIEDKNNSYAYIYFKEECNSHVYTSPDGVNWAENTSISSMYASFQALSYKYFYDNVGGEYIATLVYTNDLDYGVEPLVKPEFLDSYVESEIFRSEDITFIVDYFNISYSGTVPEAEFDFFEFMGYVTGSFGGDITSFYNYYKSLQDDSLLKDFYSFIETQTLIEGFTSDYTYEYVFFDDGSYTAVHKISLYGLVKNVVKSLQNIDNRLINFQYNLHNDLKSVFDNISLTNTYMESIDAAITDLPNYTKQFNESIGVQKDILDALERIEVSSDISLNPDSSGSSGTTTNFDMTVFNNWMSELDSSIDNISGLVAMDEMTDIFDSVVDESGETIGSLSTFLDGVNDEATISQLDDVGNYISAAMVSITKLKVLDAAFSYAGGLSNGIGFINAYADNFYAASGDYAPVFIVGTAMVCVNMFVRRRE